MWDNSSIILADQRGQNMAAGIQQVGQAFSRGIQGYYERKKQKEKEDATTQWLEQSGAANNLFPQLATIQDPVERKKVISAGIKGAGLENMAQIAEFSAKQKRQQQETEALNEMRRAQAAQDQAKALQLQDQMKAAKTEDAARQAAFDPIQESQQQFAGRGGYLTRDPRQAQLQTRDATPPEMIMKYGRAGGRDPKFMKEVNDLGGGQFTPKFTPAEALGGPKGATVLTTSPKSVQLVQPQRAAEPAVSALDKLIRERDSWKSQGRTDVVEDYSRVIDAMGVKYDMFGVLLPPRKPTSNDEADPFSEAPAISGAAPAQLPTPKSKAERDALPSGSSYIGPDGKIHVRK